MAEWSKAHDWKSCVPPKGTVSSNLTLSAIKTKRAPLRCFFCFKRGEWEENSRGSEFDKECKPNGGTAVAAGDAQRSGADFFIKNQANLTLSAITAMRKNIFSRLLHSRR